MFGALRATRIGAGAAHRASLRPMAKFLRHYSTTNSYFSLFPKSFPQGGPPKDPFKVDKSTLKREYLELQNKAHPDRGSTAEESEKLSNLSSQLSVAYKALLDPLRRAENILLSRGIDALAEKDSLTEEDLLMDVLMAREAIAEAESEEELSSIKQENNIRILESENILEEAFNKDDLETARSEVVKLSYWMSIKKQLDEAA
uniref:ARAD1D44044p n=1 Tax=Blastobotrys adeninivorans TaxID=409370 RepID=A0A060TDI0_BLAAD